MKIDGNSGFVFTILLAIIVTASIVCAQEDPGFDLRPLVSVNRGKNYYDGNRVGVNVPGIYDMNLTAHSRNGTELAINVLFGLVRVNLQRKHDPHNPYGHTYGPISVEVFGFPVYTQQN